MEITAAVVNEEGTQPQLETVKLDGTPRADEVLVRVVSAGVCHTDLSTAENFYGGPPYPQVLGHEGQASSRPSARTSRASGSATTSR